MGRIAKMLEDTFVEVAFAEANVESGLRRSGTEGRRKRGRSVGDWLDEQSMAAAFAGAGDHETARAMARPQEAQGPRARDSRSMILVVGGADSFSDELVAYAVDMAGRMKASIMALNINKTKDEAYAASFRQAAEEQGVSFSHLVRAGNRDQIVEALSRKHDSLQYVMTEPPRPTRTSIPVYRPAPVARSTRPRARTHV